MTHVVIRCDASLEGGIGHLVRAISVASAARAAGESVVLAGSIRSELGLELVARAGLEVVVPSDDLGVLAAEQGATVVHVDHYDIGRDALSQVHRSGAVLSSMEDGVFGRRPADVVVDSTIRAETLGRPHDGSGTVLLGIAYAPMRSQVLEARERRSVAPRKLDGDADVLVVMGGTDATGAAGTIAAVCRRAAGVGRVTAIASGSSKDAVRREAGDDVEVLEPSPEFLEMAARADLVVSAAGTTSWELICIGVPSVLVAVVANQRAGLDAAVDEGVALSLGTVEEVRADPRSAVARMEAAVAALRDGAPWASTGLTKVDGHGADRIVRAWEAAMAERLSDDGTQVHARPATSADSLLLLRWRNDPETRAVSRNTAAVTWAEHSAWFEGILRAHDRQLYVVQRGSIPVGTVRFDEDGPSEWEVSITLAPEARGHRLGRPVLAAAEAAFRELHPTVSLSAAILPNNAASQKLFSGAGYVLDPSRHDGAFDTLIRVPARGQA